MILTVVSGEMTKTLKGYANENGYVKLNAIFMYFLGLRQLLIQVKQSLSCKAFLSF